MRTWMPLAAALSLTACAAGDLGDDAVDDACVDGTAPELCQPETWRLADEAEAIVAADDDPEDLILKAGKRAVEVGPPTRRRPIALATDGDVASYALRIRDERRQRPKAVYSVRLTDLQPDERVKVVGEAMISFCDDKDRRGDSSDAATTPCTRAHMQRAPYRYTPRLSAAFVLSDGPRPNGRRVSSWRETTCSKEKHHCALTLPRVTLKDVPAGGDKWLHLVVTADARGADAKSWHVMEVEQGKGRLTVARLAPEVKRLRAKTTDDLVSRGWLGVDQTPDEGDFTQVQRIVFRQPLKNLKKGDLLTAHARMHATLERFDCDPLISTQLLLTDRPNEKEPNDALRRLTVKNGFNCRAHGGGECVYTKSGAIRLDDDLPGTSYLTMVAMAKRSCAAPHGRDRWKMNAGKGELSVEVFRAE
ncbi:MAG: hypothetical protein KC583_03820 [Myxococcales bacterium]|nr:hypothetical protein [Myxococcales bacterium]